MEDEVLKINRKLQSFLWQLLSKIEKRIGQTQSALTEVGKHIRTIHSGPKCLWSPGRLIELPPLFDSQGNIPNIPPSIQERQSLVEEKLPLRHEPSKWSTGDDDKLRKIVKEVCVVSRVQKLSQIWLDSGGAEEVRLEIMGAGDKEIAMDEVDALNWGEIANMMQGRLSRECEFRWKNFAGTHINRSEEWSDEESVLLIKLAKKYSGRNWDFISKELNVLIIPFMFNIISSTDFLLLKTGRTAFQCFERFQVYHNANIKSS